MRRLVNLCLLLVLLGAVGYLLYKAKLIPLGHSTPTPTPTAAPAPARETLRISVAHRPEILIVSALKRLLEAQSRKIEIVAFDPETTWMELAAGEIDLVIAPIGEAVTAQARFQAGRFLFISGLSEGYDVILARAAGITTPKTLGITGGPGGELFALQSFPDARLVSAPSQAHLQAWLTEGAVQAALLESAGLKGELAHGARLVATDAKRPVPTVVVLSRAMLEEGPGTAQRAEVLLMALESWEGLVDYLSTQPELLRSTLKKEADDLGVDVDILLKDYRFLPPNEGRDTLLQSYDDGLLNRILDLLVLARTTNLTAPKWDDVLTLPAYLEAALPGGGSPATTPSPTPDLISPTPDVNTSATPIETAGAVPESSYLGSHHFSGSAPADPWPNSPKVKKLVSPGAFAPAATESQVGVATTKSFEVYESGGALAFSIGDRAPVSAPLADSTTFYVTSAGKLEAISAQGKVVWSYDFEGTPGAVPVLTPSDIVFCLDGPNGHLVVAVSKETGLATWQTNLPTPAASPPVYADSPQPSILVADDQGNLHAWHAQTGTVLWQSSLNGATLLPLSTMGDSLAVNTPDGTVRLLSLADGSQVWQADLATALASAPTLTDSLVLVPAKDTYLYALDRTNGTIKTKKRLSAPLSSPAVVIAEHVYECDDNGGVHSLTLPTLELNWSKALAKAPLLGPTFSAHSWSLVGDGSLLIYPR